MSHEEPRMVEVLRRLVMVMALKCITVNKAEIRTSCLFSYSHYSAGSIMSQTMSRSLLNAETRVLSRANPCGICGGRSGSGSGLSPSTSNFCCKYLLTTVPYTSFIRTSLTKYNLSN